MTREYSLLLLFVKILIEKVVGELKIPCPVAIGISGTAPEFFS